MKLFLCLFVLSMFATSAFADAKKVAVVKMLRGTANAMIAGKNTLLKAEDWVEDGSTVKTEEKSFVKLVFLDKSTMNIGPNSEMKIEKFNGKDSGVIDLVKGKIRSQVTKDYLQIKDKDKSKLFIKTSNAVMGVRGTDFMISTNGVNTATVLFEGEVVFNNLEDTRSIDSNSLEAVVNAGVRMVPGEFSVVDAGAAPTVPSVLNIQQHEKLEKNSDFNESSRAPASASEQTSSVVPPGLTGASVSNSMETIKTEVADVAPASIKETPAAVSNDAGGFANADGIKPTNGSFVHIESGVVIPPAAGSVFDPNTNSYIAASGSGEVAGDGSYIPPENVKIADNGTITVTIKTDDGGTKTVDVAKINPVTPQVAPINTKVADSGDQETTSDKKGREPANEGEVKPPKPQLTSPFPSNPTPLAPPVPDAPAMPVPLPPQAGVTPQNDPGIVSGQITNGNYTIRPHKE